MRIRLKVIGKMFILLSLFSITCNTTENTDYTEWVFPHIDTENSRWFFFSSACRPFGMVNLSPDTQIDGAWNSGYVYCQDSVLFFSHIHAWQLSGIPVLPVNGPFKGHFGPRIYGSRFSHHDEIVKPGYHSIFLKDYEIKAELTSSARTGFHRYLFPANDESYVLLDLATLLGPSTTLSGYALKMDDRNISGYAIMEKTHRRPKPVYIYYHIEFQIPFQYMQAWQDSVLLGKTDVYQGSNGGVYLKFDTPQKTIIQFKVGISYVSSEQARTNMQEEIPHWDFDRVVAESKDEWNAQLGKIKVHGGTLEQRKRFYTDLWKTLQGRRIISDVNGQYCDMTGPEKRVGQIPLDPFGNPLFNHYNSDSFWGAQWTISTLWSLVYPQYTREFVYSMLRMYQDGGLVPRGPSGGNYTFVMTGASSTPFIISALMKGILSDSLTMVYQGLRKNHMPGGMMGKAGYEHQTALGGGIEEYITQGYVPYPLDRNGGWHQEGAGQTLEYAFQDWCLAQLAGVLGDQADYQLFMDRSENWKNLFDSNSGWIRPKDRNGKWKAPFDPYQHKNGFVEANAAQATWFVPHNLPGLADLMGGYDKMAARLDSAFKMSQNLDFTAGKAHSQELIEAYSRIPINYGNEPSIQTAFIFNHIGYPWLTQYWSRQVVERTFSGLSPARGYNGDEDQGMMGALAVLMKMGLFEMKSGCEQRPVIELGSPLFTKITIYLDKRFYTGKTFIIKTKNNNPENCYIQNAFLNGQPLPHPWFFFDELTNGGQLELVMSKIPNKVWNNQQ